MSPKLRVLPRLGANVPKFWRHVSGQPAQFSYGSAPAPSNRYYRTTVALYQLILFLLTLFCSDVGHSVLFLNRFIRLLMFWIFYREILKLFRQLGTSSIFSFLSRARFTVLDLVVNSIKVPTYYGVPKMYLKNIILLFIILYVKIFPSK